jgi:acetoin utilization protein AcuB
MQPHHSTGKLQKPIRNFMTPGPHSIGRDQPLSVAQDRMRILGVRHLPVLEGGKLVGILSQRDVLFVETLRDVEPSQVTVEDAMTSDVYVIEPNTALVEVAEAMAEHKYGCAVVMDEGHLAGIFTTVDALRVLIDAARGESG